MPTTITHRVRPPTERSARTRLLTRLATAVREYGGTAVLALSHTAHPVLYVRYRGRTVPVVLIQGLDGRWWFLWGRAGLGDASQIEAVAAHLAGADALAPPQFPAPRKQVA
ncbi:hypothetical protein ACFQZ2_00815 [Streptomonospora algeriensis]|uniref:Immunity protein 35 domain-containing protein n=1 Tax=Streptomonospora algeriensis TaxID=995084 RepID=A0ABW3BAS0_9ACTN